MDTPSRSQKEAKDLVDGAPKPVKEGLSKRTRNDLKKVYRRQAKRVSTEND